jgi:streptogramin lyase
MAGLFRLTPDDAGSGTFERFGHDSTDSRSLSNNRINAVLVDRRGDVWVGTESGLDRLDRGGPARATFTKYRAGPTTGNGLIDTEASSIYEDSRGRLWVGSLPGVSVFDSTRSRITHFYHRYRTYRYGWGEAVELQEDRTGNLWIATASELMRLDPATGEFQYFRHDPLEPQGINNSDRLLDHSTSLDRDQRLRPQPVRPQGQPVRAVPAPGRITRAAAFSPGRIQRVHAVRRCSGNHLDRCRSALSLEPYDWRIHQL